MKKKLVVIIVILVSIVALLLYSLKNTTTEKIKSLSLSVSELGDLQFNKVTFGFGSMVVKDLKVTPKIDGVDSFLTIVFPEIEIDLFSYLVKNELNLFFDKIGIDSNNATVLVANKLNTNISTSLNDNVLAVSYIQKTPKPGVDFEFDVKISNFTPFELSLFQTDLEKAFSYLYQYDLESMHATMCDTGAIYNGYFRAASVSGVGYEDYIKSQYRRFDSLALNQDDKIVLNKLINFLINLNTEKAGQCISIATGLKNKLNFVDFFKIKPENLITELNCDISIHD